MEIIVGVSWNTGEGENNQIYNGLFLGRIHMEQSRCCSSKKISRGQVSGQKHIFFEN